jgi:hypothetical protein
MVPDKSEMKLYVECLNDSTSREPVVFICGDPRSLTKLSVSFSDGRVRGNQKEANQQGARCEFSECLGTVLTATCFALWGTCDPLADS